MGKERDAYFRSLSKNLTYRPKEHFQIGARHVGSGQPTYIIAEIGANHTKDLKKALDLIEAAKDAGADAVKFQHLKAKGIAADTPVDLQWQGKSGWKTLSEFYVASELPYEWTPELISHCKKVGIDFLSTPFDFEAVDLLERTGVSAFKVASYELTDDLLLRKIAATKKPVIISTGMAYLEEVAHAVNVLVEAGCAEIAVLHCVSIYPPKDFSDLNLRAIETLQSALHLPIGYSDHSKPGSVAACLGAVALGACILEKHLTGSQQGGSHDDSNSIEPKEFKRLVNEVRLLESAMSPSGIKQPVVYSEHAGDEVSDRWARRSLYAARDIPAGSKISEQDVVTLRPWGGIEPKNWPIVQGRRTTRAIKARSPLSWEDFFQE